MTTLNSTRLRHQVTNTIPIGKNSWPKLRLNRSTQRTAMTSNPLPTNSRKPDYWVQASTPLSTTA